MTRVTLTKEEYADLLDAFAEILDQADEDCPSEFRSRHFRAAIREGKALHKRHFKKYRKLFPGNKEK